MKLVLLRHGAVEGLDPPRFRGRKNIRLTELGRRQAQATAAFIAGTWTIDAIVSSPLSRCVDTAATIAAAVQVTPATSDLLLDFDYGEWAWMTHSEVRAAWPDLYESWFETPQLVQIPGGETLHDLFGRAAAAWRMLLNAYAGRTIVAVAHDTFNRALLTQFLDLPLSGYWRIRQDPCCINLIDAGERIEVQTVNSISHLAQLERAQSPATPRPQQGRR